MKDTFRIQTDRSLMDVDFIYNYLSTTSYWAAGRTRDAVIQTITHSLCFGVFNNKDQQVGFARVITDYVAFAWILDVFVIPEYQGNGIGKSLIDFIVNFKALSQVKGIGLKTKDAHKLYQKFGFEMIDDPEIWMYKKQQL